jgi:predicted transcriptional regulator
MNMDDKARLLKLLADRSQDAVGLCSRLGISPNTLFSLLRKMEKEDLIVWKGREWAVKPSSESRQNGSPDSSHPSEGGSNA